MDELAKERYDLAVERIREIREEKTVAEPYLDFFTKTAGFLEEMIRLRDRVEAGEMKKLSLEELRRENTQCYQDILPENYPTSYASPDYAAKMLGEDLGVLLYRTSRNDRVCLGAEKLGFSGGTGTVFAGVQRV